MVQKKTVFIVVTILVLVTAYNAIMTVALIVFTGAIIIAILILLIAIVRSVTAQGIAIIAAIATKFVWTVNFTGTTGVACVAAHALKDQTRTIGINLISFAGLV